MITKWDRVNGTLERGHKVASGQGKNSPYPSGTIEMQTPFFKELGLDLRGYFKGTLNVSISPNTFKILKPEFTFKDVEWTDKHPPETFSFSSCRIIFKKCRYNSWIYYPHPETKKRHFQEPYIVEIIAPFIPEINYGDAIELEYKLSEIIVNSCSE
ncbi:MAG: hypothetical protein QNJ38_16725 [Prochloraceae cyanobacterium]|nr:hypothetical protein [Prochloraceae cyanobacterium]